jgi:hypothetical protein
MSSTALAQATQQSDQENTNELSFAELDAATSTSKTWLLTFFHSRVTRQEPAFTKCFMKGFVHAYQCTGEAHPYGSALASHATT